jgi:hypothetical protein
MSSAKNAFLQEYLTQIRKLTFEIENTPHLFDDHDFTFVPAGVLALQRTNDVMAMRADIKRLEPNWFEKLVLRFSNIKYTETK